MVKLYFVSHLLVYRRCCFRKQVLFIQYEFVCFLYKNIIYKKWRVFGVFKISIIYRHDSTIAPTLVAGYAASILTKRCGHLAFKKYGRSTTTTDLINEINPTFN